MWEVDEGLKEIKYLIRLEILKHRLEFEHLYSKSRGKGGSSVKTTPYFPQALSPLSKDVDDDCIIGKQTQAIEEKVDKTIRMFELASPSYSMQAKVAGRTT